MASANTALRVTELDFVGIKNNLKEFLKSQSEFTDYNFEGSGMSVLLDILAYNTYYNSFYLNMAANEAFLDTAQVRKNIISLAKQIGYTPTSSQGALGKITVTATPSIQEDNTTNIITIDKYTRLFGKDISGTNYPFVTINANTASKVNGSFTFANLFIKQGEAISREYMFYANNTTRSFQIDSGNVDTTTLVVRVQESPANTKYFEYTRAEDLTVVDANSKVYFLEENENEKYTIKFGDDVIGKRPPNNSVVILTYLDSVGSVANNISSFTFRDKVGTLFSDNVIITTVTGTYGGTDKESIDTIRFRSKYAYAAQNRAVTIKDYESILTKEYNNIESVKVWSGEDNDPVVYGKVFMSLKTKGFYALSEVEKQQIKDDLIGKRNVLTVIPEIIDPDYTFVTLSGRVTYNPNLTSKSGLQLLQDVRTAIQQYDIKELNKFDSVFRKSKLQFYIENADPSITGSDISIILQKQVDISPGLNKNYSVNFYAPLTRSNSEKFFTYPQLTVLDSVGIQRNVFFEEFAQSTTGIDSISVFNTGSNYTSIPTVTISGDGTGAEAVATVVNGKVTSIQVTKAGYDYTRAFVTISGGGGFGASATAIINNNVGSLRTFYYKENGEKVIVNTNAGTIDYINGKITLSSLYATAVPSNAFYDSNVLTLNASPREQIITPVRNGILALDFNNAKSIQIEIVAE